MNLVILEFNNDLRIFIFVSFVYISMVISNFILGFAVALFLSYKNNALIRS